MGDTQSINTIMAFLILLAITAAIFVRENTSALDMLANWAACRSWGLKCVKAEAERRRETA